MKPIPGHEMYAIDEYGNVWSDYVDRFVRATIRRGDTSYFKVGLLVSSKPKRYKHYYIHQLVLLTYVGPCPHGMQVDHIDGNSTNNQLSNLRYVSARGNSENRKRHGKHYTSFTRKVDSVDVLSLKNSGIKYAAIATTLGISERQVSRIIHLNEVPE